MSSLLASSHSRNKPGLALLIGALGVVYGDIGTSPLYALQLSLASLHGGVIPKPHEIISVLSLFFWLLTIVVSVKYVIFILRADNKGEGGILALMEIAVRYLKGNMKRLILLLGVVGACLFYGDSVITPAISVMSALEGVSVIAPTLEHWVVPLSVLIVFLLFYFQSHGTGKVGRFFGPIMLLWFGSLTVFGLYNIVQHPIILEALNPYYAIAEMIRHPIATFVLLAFVVLGLTGAEALYADMGHFGRPAISRAWFMIVYPALVITYFGQGAYALGVSLVNPTALVGKLFFVSLPSWALIPMIILATVASIIASQAVISGAFSITRQAVQLGFWPKMAIQFTSSKEQGQIYIPVINWCLMCGVMALIIMLKTSDNLGHAYGFAVTGTMLITSMIAFVVLPRFYNGWKRYAMVSLVVLFFVIDVMLFSVSSLKLHEGGWISLLIATMLFTLMYAWDRGINHLNRVEMGGRQELKPFLNLLINGSDGVSRVGGTAVFLSGRNDLVPSALLHNLKHNKVLQEQLLFVSVRISDVPYLNDQERYDIEEVCDNAWVVTLHYGFMDEPDIPKALELVAQEYTNIDVSYMATSYFLSRHAVMLSGKGNVVGRIFTALFAFMNKNAMRFTRFYKIPPNRVVEMGVQVEW